MFTVSSIYLVCMCDECSFGGFSFDKSLVFMWSLRRDILTLSRRAASMRMENK